MRILGEWGAPVGSGAELRLVCGRPPGTDVSMPLLLVGEPDSSGRWPLVRAEPGSEAWVLAVDVSGSMDGAKLTAVESAVRTLAESVGPEVRVQVVPFAAEPGRPTDAKDWRAPRGAGGTNLVRGMTAGKQALGSASRGTVVLFSDGNDPVAPLGDVRPQWNAWAAGIGADADTAVLAQLVGHDRVLQVGEEGWASRLVALREHESGGMLGSTVELLVPGLGLPDSLELGDRSWAASTSPDGVALFGDRESVVVGVDRAARARVVQAAVPAQSMPSATAGLLATWLTSGDADLPPGGNSGGEWSRAGEVDAPGIARLRSVCRVHQGRREASGIPAAAGCCLLGLGAVLEGRAHRRRSRR